MSLATRRVKLWSTLSVWPVSCDWELSDEYPVPKSSMAMAKWGPHTATERRACAQACWTPQSPIPWLRPDRSAVSALSVWHRQMPGAKSSPRPL